MSKPPRRPLRFQTLDEAIAEAERLLSNGYERAGNWDLAQCCHHLAAVMTYPIDGFPPFSFPLNFAAWVLRHTIAPGQLRKVLNSGVWPTGTPTDKRTVPVQGGDEAQAVRTLKVAIDRLLGHTGPLQASPLFGMLDKETLIRLHCIHTAHHLSFLVPRGSTS